MQDKRGQKFFGGVIRRRKCGFWDLWVCSSVAGVNFHEHDGKSSDGFDNLGVRPWAGFSANGKSDKKGGIHPRVEEDAEEVKFLEALLEWYIW